MTSFHKGKPMGTDAIAYYDYIASQYDNIQSKQLSNKIVRDKVRERFLFCVKGKTMLDFGGGTGSDLEWLVQHSFRVYFCEPSEKMRERAVHLNEKKIKSQQVTFLKEEETNFMEWDKNNPFPEKMDAVLANFAVLNNIEDIQALFRILSAVLKPEGVIVATVLRPGFLKFHRKGFLKSVILRIKKERIKLPWKGPSDGFTYIYPPSLLARMSEPFFSMTAVDKLSGSDFVYVEFKKAGGHPS